MEAPPHASDNIPYPPYPHEGLQHPLPGKNKFGEVKNLLSSIWKDEKGFTSVRQKRNHFKCIHLFLWLKWKSLWFALTFSADKEITLASLRLTLADLAHLFSKIVCCIYYSICPALIFFFGWNCFPAEMKITFVSINLFLQLKYHFCMHVSSSVA